MRLSRLPLVVLITAVALLGASRAEAATVTNTDHDLSYGRLLFEGLSSSGHDLSWSRWRLVLAPGVTSSSFMHTIRLVKSTTDRCGPDLGDAFGARWGFALGGLVVLDNHLYPASPPSVSMFEAPSEKRDVTLCWYAEVEGAPSRLLLSSRVSVQSAFAPKIRNSDPDPRFGQLHLSYADFDGSRIDWFATRFFPASGVSIEHGGTVQAIERFGRNECAADAAAEMKEPGATSRFEGPAAGSSLASGSFSASVAVPPLRNEVATLCWYLHEGGRSRLAMRSDLTF